MKTEEREALNELMTKAVGAVYEVARVLGAGFLEKVYERALLREIRRRGLHAEAQVPLEVSYKGDVVGEYFADVLVEEKLIIELKCVERLAPEHLAQCLNYLKASDRHLALLVNFQHPRVEWKRIVRNL